MFHSETQLQGLALSKGVAVAPVCLFNEHRHSALQAYQIDPGSIENEARRLKHAIKLSADRIEEIRADVSRRLGSAEAEIFVAQGMLLEDPALTTSILELVEASRINVEAAVAAVLEEHEARLQEVDDEYIRERSTDFGEVKRRLLDVLAGTNPSLRCARLDRCQRGRKRVVVAQELTPSLATELDTDAIMGFLTERGGPNSHAAILARALGVPAVSAVADIYSQVSCGTMVLLNGYTGEVVIHPSREAVEVLETTYNALSRHPEPVPPVPGVKVSANINTVADVRTALAMKAEGIGLYRTEYEFLMADRILDEDEQFELYASVIEQCRGEAVVFRLLDLGADKVGSFLTMPKEDNPCLGWRGSRLLLGHKELLRAQARALARASCRGSIGVLYPMVVDLNQFRRLREAFSQAIEGVPCGRIQHGIMFEVPAACLQAHELLEAADFGSVGTNDLIQYLFAVDRDNELVAADYDPDNPVLWTVLRNLVQAAWDTDRPLSVCGELAGDPQYTTRLLQTGITNLSVSPRLIPDVRRAVTRTRERAQLTGSKSLLPAPHSGHSQSSGRSSNDVPGATPLSGSPSAGS